MPLQCDSSYVTREKINFRFLNQKRQPHSSVSFKMFYLKKYFPPVHLSDSMLYALLCFATPDKVSVKKCNPILFLWHKNFLSPFLISLYFIYLLSCFQGYDGFYIGMLRWLWIFRVKGRTTSETTNESVDRHVNWSLVLCLILNHLISVYTLLWKEFILL